ncbi:alpha-L-fucosidase-like [Haliotis rubra]|uniref:alpha-L-fucosidase-like n=1 Tax=Haliotis rubra TaxID=36100 RepID=UPI001EE5D7B4|nr:alpha-L-fucosidase-like [Haliotis rubra]
MHLKSHDNKMAADKVLLVFSLLIFVLSARGLKNYSPTWESIDSRPLPPWYDEAKLGIFIHWGVFSVPSFRSEWFWNDWKGGKTNDTVKFMHDNYRPDFTYADFAAQFTAEFFNPAEWAEIFNSSGAQYVVLTSKHHEGFTNWPSKYSFNWNSMDNGPNRDLVGELAAAIRQKTKIHFGLYHSLFEWFHPLYLQDKANNFSTNNFVKYKTLPELYEIVNAYKPEVIWSDGDWDAPDTYWQSREFIAWLYNDSPVRDTVVTNDRWGNGVMCHHGGFLTCSDRYNPGKLQKRKFENAMTIDSQSWGYHRNTTLTQFLTIESLLETFVSTVSCGGNMLMNVGPTKDGRIIPLFQERLKQMGDWLKVNGEAIYSSRPWTSQNDTLTSRVWYTSKKQNGGTSVYAVVLDWPKGDTLSLGDPVTSLATTVSLLGYPGNFNWQKREPKGIDIEIPPIPFNKIPCQWAWTFKFTGLAN